MKKQIKTRLIPSSPAKACEESKSILSSPNPQTQSPKMAALCNMSLKDMYADLVFYGATPCQNT